MRITISQSFVRLPGTADDGSPCGYVGYNAVGKGKPVATVDGIDRMDNDNMAVLGGDRYALRDVLLFAQRGEHGLTTK